MHRFKFIASIFLFLFISKATFAEQEASRVRVLLVIDTHAERVEQAVINGGTRLYNALETIKNSPELKGRITIDLLGTGPQPVTPEEVRQYYRNLKTNPSEALLFYYNGHGAYDANRGHYFDMSGGQLLRSEVLTLLKSHRTRLKALISDACSGIGTYNGKPEQRFEQRTVTKYFWNEPNTKVFTDLFFRQTGIIDVTSAQTPQLAWIGLERMGLFTSTFANLISGEVAQVDVDGDGQIMWNEFLRKLRWDTNHAFKEFKKQAQPSEGFADRMEQTQEQTPELYQFPSYVANQTLVQVAHKKAVVDGVWARDESARGFNGMTLLIDATAWNMKGRTIQLAAYFRYDDGQAIRSRTHPYRADDGTLATYKESKVLYDNSRFNYFELYIPYSLIPRSTENKRVGLYINIRDMETDLLMGGSIFMYERFSPQNRLQANAEMDAFMPSFAPEALSPPED